LLARLSSVWTRSDEFETRFDLIWEDFRLCESRNKKRKGFFLVSFLSAAKLRRSDVPGDHIERGARPASA
jgi:hypothetical protein